MSRPTREAADEEDDGSEYEQSGAPDDDEEEDLEADESEDNADESEKDEEAQKAAPSQSSVKPKPVPRRKGPAKRKYEPRTKKRKKRQNYDTDTSDTGHLLPTVLRKTNKGGYAHTMRSRARISKANTGNTPWNKGRERSEADKAKIATAVRARNSAILKEKLQKFNMTEEEFRIKQKEIKYLRERVRRAKVNAAKKKEEQLDANTLKLQCELDEAIALRDKVVNTKTKPFKKPTKAEQKRMLALQGGTSKQDDVEEGAEVQPTEEENAEDVVKDALSNMEQPVEKTGKKMEEYATPKKKIPESVKRKRQSPKAKTPKKAKPSLKAKTPKKPKPTAPKPPPPSRLPTYGWNMEWTEQEFDSTPPSCPNGGPSGLICCETCSAAYSQYMTQTVEDMETRRMESVSNQVEELLGYIEETRMQLLVTTQAAQKMAPPPLPAPTTAKRTKFVRSNPAESALQSDSDLMEWCVTSTLDMSNWGPNTARI